MIVLLESLLVLACSTSKPTFVQQGEVQLSLPQITVDRVFFEEETIIRFGALTQGLSLYVTDAMTHGNSEQLINKNNLKISQSSKLLFCAKGSGFIPSEAVKIELFKTSKRNTELSFLSPRAEPYDKAEASVLFDLQKASRQFSDRGWLGFKRDTVQIELTLKDEEIQGVALSFLEDQKSWIFGPASMCVEGFGESGTLLFSDTVAFDPSLQKEQVSFRFLESSFGSSSPHKLRLTIVPLAEIPSWHPGQGSRPWLFIDEIVLL